MNKKSKEGKMRNSEWGGSPYQAFVKSIFSNKEVDDIPKARAFVEDLFLSNFHKDRGLLDYYVKIQRLHQEYEEQRLKKEMENRKDMEEEKTTNSYP